MQSSVRPEVLANDWLPPVALGRNAPVAELVRRLDPPRPVAPPPWIVAVAGPSGSGTSVVARSAAREVLDRLRSARPGPSPRLLAVRTGPLRGTHGVASALLRRLDEGFDGRGFPVAEILAGLLRRLRREGRPVVFVLDDLGVGGPDVAPIVRAFADPDRFLPEGEVGLPPTWGLIAGSADALTTLDRALQPHSPIGPWVELGPYTERDLERIVRDRVERCLGPGAGEELVRPTVHLAVAEGGGAARAIDLLRRRLVGAPLRTSILSAPRPSLGVTLEPHVLRALDAAVRGQAAPVGEVRRAEAELARAGGARPLPTTTLWRRIVQLERAGYVRREIRPGGTGGTRSIVRLLAPIDEWVTTPPRPGSPRDAVGSEGAAGGPGAGVPAIGRSGPWSSAPDDPAG